MSFDFQFPEKLWLLVLLIPIILIYLNTKIITTKLRRYGILAARILLLLLLILALSGFRIVQKSDELCVLFILDSSLSMKAQTKGQVKSQLELLRGRIQKASETKLEKDSAGLIVFGREAMIEVPPNEGFKIKEKRVAQVKRDMTDISKAIRLAMATFPSGKQKRIILISDGNENLGNAINESRVASANNVRIDTFYVPPDKNRSEFKIEQLIAPEKLTRTKDMKIKINIVYSSTKDMPATVRVERDDGHKIQGDVQLRKGRHVLVFEDNLETSDIKEWKHHTYMVVISPKDRNDDSKVENNYAYTTVRIEGAKQRILLADKEPEELEALKEVLRRNDKDVDVAGLAQMPTNAGEFMQYDIIVLSNVPASEITHPQQEFLRSMVEGSGKGLVMIGGQESFGVGGYIGSPVEEALPVYMTIKRKLTEASLAMVLVIDKSGSMGSLNKMQLAKEAASLTLRPLGAQDKLGVVAFDELPKVVINMEPVTNKAFIDSRIRTVQPGGGTRIFEALQKAYQILKDTEAQLKHIILITDGQSYGGAYKPLLDKMFKEDMTLSTIGLSQDVDAKLLEELAFEGGGEYYQVNDPKMLPRIMTKETITKMSNYIIEEEFTPRVTSSTSIGVRDINWDKVPSLYGYVGTTAKGRSELLLKTHKDDPLLCKWRYGLGKSVAFTSDAKPKWAENWVKWTGFEKMWNELITWLNPEKESGNINAVFDIDNTYGKIVVDYLNDEGNFENMKDMLVGVIRPNGTTEQIPMKQVAPGRYVAKFETTQNGAYWGSIMERQGKDLKFLKTVTNSVPYSPEFDDSEEGEKILKNLSTATGGKNLRQLLSSFKHDQKPVDKPIEVWKELLTIAMFLMMLEVAFRRIVLPKRSENKSMANVKLGAKAKVHKSKAAEAISEREKKLKTYINKKVKETHYEEKIVEEDHATETQTNEREIDPDDNSYTSRLFRAKKRGRDK